MGSGKRIRAAVEKYGRDNFQKEILFIFDNEEEMNAKEAELVTEEVCANTMTYNLCVGGRGGFSFINANGLNWTPEKNNRISGVKSFSREQRRFYASLGGRKIN